MKQLLLTAAIALAGLAAQAQTIHTDTTTGMMYVHITPTLNKSYDNEQVTTLWIVSVTDRHTTASVEWELHSATGTVMDRQIMNLGAATYSAWDGQDASLFTLLANYLRKTITE